MNIAVIFAGGVGTRMRSSEKPKQFLTLHKKPIIIHTLEYFQQNERIDAIVISCVEEWIPYLNGLLVEYKIDKVKTVVSGGETGQLSIYNGLCAAEEYANSMNENNAIVLIHDGVRPLINQELILNNIDCVVKYGSAITTSPVTETILEISSSENLIRNVPERKNSRVAKAPQSFYLNDILSVHRRALEEGITDYIDSCTMMAHYDYNLHLVDGPSENIKITTPEDFFVMKAMLDAKENQQNYGFED